MTQLFHPLLALIASSTDKELAKYIEFLKVENQILRDRIQGQVHTTYEERKRLLKFGKPLGRAVEELITIVLPATFKKWVLLEKNGKLKPKASKGRRRKPTEHRDLVIKIAEETGFGLTRIIGELRKLGIGIAKFSVENYRVRPRKPPFLDNRVKGLVFIDFFFSKSDSSFEQS